MNYLKIEKINQALKKMQEKMRDSLEIIVEDRENHEMRQHLRHLGLQEEAKKARYLTKFEIGCIVGKGVEALEFELPLVLINERLYTFNGSELVDTEIDRIVEHSYINGVSTINYKKGFKVLLTKEIQMVRTYGWG